MNASITVVNLANSGLFETNSGFTSLDPYILVDKTFHVFEQIRTVRGVTGSIMVELENKFFPPNIPDLNHQFKVITFLLDDGDLIALYKFPKASRKACEIAALHFGCKLVNKAGNLHENF